MGVTRTTMVAESTIKSTMPMPMAEVIKSTTVVAEVIKSTMVTTMDTTMGVAAVAIVALDGNLDCLNNLKTFEILINRRKKINNHNQIYYVVY